jgi:ATP-dependent helicase YprA (DUF1998 family)
MNIFEYRRQLIEQYAAYTRSFIHIKDTELSSFVDSRLDSGVLWPEPLIQLNPSFEPGESIDSLVERGELHDECGRVFRIKSDSDSFGQPLRLHRHQSDAVAIAREGHPYVLTTGTGSGKSMAYIVPIVDHVLRRGSGRGIQAIVVYPMNALANSQRGELRKFLCNGYPEGSPPVTFDRYTGQESREDRERILAQPPDILLTNYVMLELILTRPQEARLIDAAQGLQFLVLDELHTYRGRQGADVAFLIRRVRDFLNSPGLQCVGTSATLAGGGRFVEQQTRIAEVASQIFGLSVRPDHVVGETLRRATPATDLHDLNFVIALRDRVLDFDRVLPTTYQEFINDPLSVWIESTFGVQSEDGSSRLIRVSPRSISGAGGAAEELSQLTGVISEQCSSVIQNALQAGFSCEPDPFSGRPPFAFRLHQFISRGDTVFSSIENGHDRPLTLTYQQFVPNSDRQKVLLPLVFCRECGQEYFCVRQVRDDMTGKLSFVPRDLTDRTTLDDTVAGYIFFSETNSWPSHDAEQVLDRLPEDWLEERNGQRRIKRNREPHLPHPVRVNLLGEMAGEGVDCHFLTTPFRFCLSCGVAYSARQTSDFGKLTALGSEGRSTATTILSMSAIRGLRASDLHPHAHKLLSFTDNRQDASLQAGHFNDFVEVGLLRGGLFGAAQSAGASGIAHDELTQRVFDQLSLPVEIYASNPNARFQTLANTQRALRNVLG